MAKASSIVIAGKARPDGRYVNVAGDTMTGTLTLNGDTFATQGWVTNSIINGAPGTLDTLNELAAALGDDANFATTVTNSLATKAPLASPVLTGTPTAPTAATATNNTQIATTAFVKAQGYITSADGGNAGLLDGIDSTSFLRSDAADTFSAILTGTATGENLKIGGIRGTTKGSQTGEYIHLYERVHIGGPAGWGASTHGAPSQGLSTWGSVDFGMNGSGVIQLDGTTIVTAARALTNVTNTNWDAAYSWGNHAGLYLGINAKAADSNLLDGLDSSRFLYTTTGAFSGDWNTLTDSNQEIRLVEVQNITGGAHSNHPTGLYTYGSVLGWQLDNATFKLYASHTGDLAFQTGWNNDGYSGWRTIIHSANIGSQSVSYATSAGNADTVDSYHVSSLWKLNEWNGNIYGHTDGRIYGTIFYDANDSNYYVNPNDTSNLNFLNLGNTREEFPLLRMGAGGRYAIGVSGAHTRISSHNQGSGVQLGSYDGTTFTPKLIVSNDGNVSAESSLRAPIFYDSQDTNYYLDPAGYSALGRIDLSSSINDSGPGARIGRNHAYDTLELQGYGAELMIGAQNSAIHINYRTCNSGASGHTPSTWYWRAGSSTNWSNHNFGSVNANGTITATSDMRAPLFYDSQDTSYYVDPNGSSRLGHLYVGDVAGSNDGSWNARMKVIGSSHARLDVVSNSDGIITTMFAHTGNGAGKMGTWSNHPLKLVIDGTDKATLDSSGNFTVVGRFTETSSQKYKTNIQDLGPTLEKVDQLRGVTYSKIGSEETEIGMIAEEVAQIFPDLISYNEEGQIESLNYTRITAVLVEAVKELNAKVKTQEIFIDNIVARLERLENK